MGRQLTKKSTNGLDWTKRPGVVAMSNIKSEDYIIGGGGIYLLNNYGGNANPYLYRAADPDPTSWGGQSEGVAEDGRSACGFFEEPNIYYLASKKGSYFKNTGGIGRGFTRQKVVTPPIMTPIAIGKHNNAYYSVGFNAGSREHSRVQIRYRSDFVIYKIDDAWENYEEVEITNASAIEGKTFDAMVSPVALIADDAIYIAGFNYTEVYRYEIDLQSPQGGRAIKIVDGFHRFLTVVKIVGNRAEVIVSRQYQGEWEIRMHKDGDNLVVVADKVSLTIDAAGNIVDSMVTSKDFTAAGYLHTGDSIRITGTPSGKETVELSVDGVTWKRYDKPSTDKYRSPKPTAVSVNLEI